ncbi:hypothetical protein F5Y06DRAFT_264262 [Hypoxylon sp. FL0890]|nr:hypothetical protein F5Y06DRAFT_264262 [Hypoxylon sp. FL0890]
MSVRKESQSVCGRYSQGGSRTALSRCRSCSRLEQVLARPRGHSDNNADLAHERTVLSSKYNQPSPLVACKIYFFFWISRSAGSHLDFSSHNNLTSSCIRWPTASWNRIIISNPNQIQASYYC